METQSWSNPDQQNPPLTTDFTPQPKRTRKRNVILAVILIPAIFLLGFSFGQNQLRLSDGRLEIVKGPSKSADYNLLWDALDLLNSKFVDRDELDQKDLLYGAIKGMMQASGDPYTTFFDPEESEQFAEQLRGSFEGIGAEIGIRENQLVIIAPLEDTPAANAGLLPGDLVLAIDGESTVGISVDQAVQDIRGPAGTPVVLNVLHENQTEAIDITIIRGNIEIKSVKFETLETNGKKIALIKVVRFGEDTQGLFAHQVDVALAGNYQGVIVDVRNNPGGYLDSAVAIASNWVADGQVVVQEVNYADSIKDYNASGLSRLAGTPTAVLVNGGSASASEILAGALQDYDLAAVVGTQTFGKGSVQELSDLSSKTSIKITTAKWLTPNGRSIDGNGLLPDIEVERTAEDVAADIDPQLTRALELF